MKVTRSSKMLKRLILNLLLFPVLGLLSVEGDPPADPPANDPPADDGNKPPEGGDKSPEDLETERRAALSDDERAAEDKAALDAAGAPEVYEDFKIPEGMETAKDLLDEFKPFLKTELNLSQAKAQALVDFYTTKILPGMQAKGMAAATDALNDKLSERAQAIKADKEIGGERYDFTVKEVNRVANTFLNADESAEMMEFFKESGDCRPYLLLLSRVGAAMKEGSIVNGVGGEGGKEKTLAERIYGDEK